MKEIAKNVAHVAIFTDGSSRGNPGRGGWAAVVVWGDKVKELGGREAHTTNNRMELTAAMKALESVKAQGVANGGSITVYTDSRYLINGVTKWVAGWKRKGWKTMQKTEVENRDLWEELDASTATLHDAMDAKIIWTYVAGHSNIPANERCDVIATSFADETKIDLYDGPVSGYTIDTKKIELGAEDVLSIEQVAAKKKAKERAKLPAYSYLSLVNGVAKRDSTWAACEARVKGAKGVKYKKAISASDEAAILKEWGATLN